jgi:hypothetical protein
MIKLIELLNEKVTFTDEYDDEMKGKQKNLPDQVQKFIKNKKTVKEGDDHEVAMAMSSLKSIIKSSVTLLNKLGNEERNIPGWIQDHITNAENYIDQAAQGFHELNEGPQIGQRPVRIYKLVQGKEAELAKVRNPKVVDYIKKNPENITMEDLAKFLSVREQAALQYINALKTLGALVSKNPTTSKPMSSDDVDDLFK